MIDDMQKVFNSLAGSSMLRSTISLRTQAYISSEGPSSCMSQEVSCHILLTGDVDWGGGPLVPQAPLHADLPYYFSPFFFYHICGPLNPSSWSYAYNIAPQTSMFVLLTCVFEFMSLELLPHVEGPTAVPSVELVLGCGPPLEAARLSRHLFHVLLLLRLRSYVYQEMPQESYYI